MFQSQHRDDASWANRFPNNAMFRFWFVSTIFLCLTTTVHFWKRFHNTETQLKCILLYYANTEHTKGTKYKNVVGTWLASIRRVFFLKERWNRKLTSRLGLAPPQQCWREVQVLDKRRVWKNMVGEKVPAKLRSFLLRILCDVWFCASHAPVQVSKNLHQSSFTPPATLLLHFPCGAWGKRKCLTFVYLRIS